MQSEAALLKTDKADTGSAFTSKEVVDLPLPEFRNYQSLLDLVPGSTPSEFPERARSTRPPRALSTNDQRHEPQQQQHPRGRRDEPVHLAAASHALRRAGGDDCRRSTSRPAASRRIRGWPAARRSRSSPSRAPTSSGDRGSAFYTDQNLRAQTYFAKRNNTPKLPTNHHIDGGTLGGPIVRNKLFYFGAFEGQYRNTAGESIYTVPTEKMRARRFQRGAQQQRFAAADLRPAHRRHRGTRTHGVCRQHHSRRIASMRSPGGSTSSTRCRTGRGTPSNYFKDYVSTFDRNQYDVKINWNRSPGHQVWGKIGVMDATVSNLQKLSFDGGGLGEDQDVGGDDRPDLHAEPIARHRHDLRLFAPRPVGVRARTTEPTTASSSACPARTVRTSARAACRSGATA